MIKIKEAKYTLPKETRFNLAAEFYRLYDAQKDAGESMVARPPERKIHQEIMAEYTRLMEDGVTFGLDELPLKILNKKYIKLNDAMSNKLLNFIYSNLGDFDFDDIRKKISEAELTTRAIEDGIDQDMLLEATDILENFVKAYNDLINWVSLDRSHFNAIAYIGNNFMKIKNLFNDADS